MRVAVDIGGTFTDVVGFDEVSNSVTLAKALSTPTELARGVMDALHKSRAPLDDTSFLIHGSTVVVNAVIERSGALTFQIKQAEALVETLRRERTLACDVSAAVASLRDEDEEEGGKA